MKKVVKVSIANMAFTLEDKAHLRLEGYLSSLRNHYINDSSAEEIIEGIEERIAELFVEKLKGLEIVPMGIVEETIAILGEPERIENTGQAYSPKPNHKKLYRDVDNSILGGVCSGLASYFGREPLLFRVIFIFLLLVMGSVNLFFEVHISFIVAIAYILMWIIVPPAKTVEDRCRMKGFHNSIEGIEDAVNVGAKEFEKGAVRIKNRFPGLLDGVANIVCRVVGFLFLLFGLLYLITILLSFWGIAIVGFNAREIIDYLFIQLVATTLSSTSAIIFQIALAIAVFVPAILFIYWGVLMLFRFKVPSWRPGSILFVVWFISFVTSLVMGLTMTTYATRHQETIKQEIEFASDTLYVRFKGVEKYENSKVSIDANTRTYSLDYFDKTDGKTQLVRYPLIKKVKSEENLIEICSSKIDQSMTMKEIREFEKVTGFAFEGDTLTLDPIIFGADYPLREVHKMVYVYVDENTEVIIENPMYHAFDRKIDYSNIFGIFD